ncbi:MAG: AmmeMemoRadiSam system protein B [Alphaproteobacteria bacterium]|nr:AmmeMemoRadiSam system protein B [Alphaproteobacteria bacterium]MBO4643562.1 AmmeMemoRadiSam system protein B [Alphaproteobacteria bacterium]
MKFKLFLLFVLCCLSQTGQARNVMPQEIRYPAMIGRFYPRDGRELSRQVSDLIDAADRRLRVSDGNIPKAVIVPHNALYFSGEVAGAGYAALKRLKPFVKRVVLIGSSHQGKYFGISLPQAQYWEMPNRRFEVDRNMVGNLIKMQGIGFDNYAHEAEFSLEMQLPFINAVFGKDVKIVPILVEDASVAQIADLIDVVWGGPETVIIISTDMSAGKDAEEVGKAIRETAARLEKKDYSSIKEKHFCAPLPVAGILAYARENGLEVQTLDLKTSADAFPMTDKVIGFGAFGIYETDNSLQADSRERLESILQTNQETLLRVAAQSIITGFERGRPLRLRENRYPEELREKGATFVNIYYNGALRGSSGSTEATRSILEDISENAYAAAFSDYRFIPLNEDEMKKAEISISFLTHPVPIRFENEEDLLSKVAPQLDGLILKERANRALFLPQTWQTFSSPKEFFIHLKQNAGLPADYWSPTVKVYRFNVIDINSGDLENPKSIWQSR